MNHALKEKLLKEILGTVLRASGGEQIPIVEASFALARCLGLVLAPLDETPLCDTVEELALLAIDTARKANADLQQARGATP
jgi:hypothetical protein